MTSLVTVLLVDDEPMLRRATAMLLSNRGARVTAAASADEAIALAGERLYDVAVIDVSRPSPLEVLRRMRAGGLVPRRVIAITSAPLARDEAAPFTAVIEKPYPFDRLLRAIFGQGARRRTRSGVFPSMRPRELARVRGLGAARAANEVRGEAPAGEGAAIRSLDEGGALKRARRAPRALRGRAG
jgi:CheY-like chemotaxis protein